MSSTVKADLTDVALDYYQLSLVKKNPGLNDAK